MAGKRAKLIWIGESKPTHQQEAQFDAAGHRPTPTMPTRGRTFDVRLERLE